MRVTSAVALACTMLLLASCSSSSTKGTGGSAKAATSNKDLIVGKWEDTEGKDNMTMEFTKDDKFKMEIGKIVMEGTYIWIDDNHIETDHLKGVRSLVCARTSRFSAFFPSSWSGSSR